MIFERRAVTVQVPRRIEPRRVEQWYGTRHTHRRHDIHVRCCRRIEDRHRSPCHIRRDHIQRLTGSLRSEIRKGPFGTSRFPCFDEGAGDLDQGVTRIDPPRIHEIGQCLFFDHGHNPRVEMCDDFLQPGTRDTERTEESADRPTGTSVPVPNIVEGADLQQMGHDSHVPERANPAGTEGDSRGFPCCWWCNRVTDRRHSSR